MLKTLKWVYKLGVRQERTRIARELEAEYSRRTIQVVQYSNMRHDSSASSAKKKDRLLYRQAVAEEVQNIVNTILEPKNEMFTSSSIMFPDDPEKK